MNAPDIRVSVTLPRHRKFRKFKRLIGPEAMEHLVALWCEVAEQAPSGELEDWTDEDVARAARYFGDPQVFVSAMVDSGFLENGGQWWRLHDWEEHQAYVVGAPARIDKARKAAAAKWRKDGPCS